MIYAVIIGHISVYNMDIPLKKESIGIKKNRGILMENKTAELAALVERARKGDKAASTELYEKMYAKLYFFAYKNVHNKEDAEDIVQEAFVRAAESLNDLISNDCFTSWIYSVTYNLCADKLRDGDNTVRFDNDDDRDNAIENSFFNEPVMVPEDYMQNEEIKRQIKDVIDGLRPDLRSVIILFYYDQMSMAEVAETMGISESGVKTKLFSARKRIKAKLRALGMNGDTTVHMTLVPLPALLALVADELDTSTAVVASPFGKAAVTATAGAAVFAAVVSMVFFTNAHRGDVRVDSGTDPAESTVSIYTEEESSETSRGESSQSASFSTASIVQQALNDTQSGSVGTDTSTQGNGDVYVDTPNNNDNNNNNYAPDAPQPNDTSSEEQSSAADSSSQVEDDVFHYIWNSRELDDSGVELVSYNGNDTNVTIPSTIGGKPITAIADEAFSSRDNVESVTIPSTVQTIGSLAFEDTSITDIHIPAATTSVGGRAFPHGTHIELEDGNNSLALYDDGSLYSADGKKLMYVGADDNDYRFPDGVEEIGECAFYESKLTKISFPEGIKIIGEKAFCGSYELTSFNFPDSLTEIRANAFSSNKSEYISIILPYNTKYVGENAFGGRKFNFAVYAADAQIGESLFWDDSERHAASSLEEYKVLKDRYKNRVNIGNG